MTGVINQKQYKYKESKNDDCRFEMKMSSNKIIALVQSSPRADILRPLCILNHVIVAEAPRDRYTTPLLQIDEPRPRSCRE